MKRPRPISVGPSRTKAYAVEAAIAGEDRTAYLMGISQFAEMIGRSRDTVSDWIHKHDCSAKIVNSILDDSILDDDRI